MTWMLKCTDSQPNRDQRCRYASEGLCLRNGLGLYGGSISEFRQWSRLRFSNDCRRRTLHVCHDMNQKALDLGMSQSEFVDPVSNTTTISALLVI